MSRIRDVTGVVIMDASNLVDLCSGCERDYAEIDGMCPRCFDASQSAKAERRSIARQLAEGDLDQAEEFFGDFEH